MPRDGTWNMMDKKFHRAVTINRWVVIIYERKQRFDLGTVREMVRNFTQQFTALGMCTRI